jgi:hypothetical protein
MIATIPTTGIFVGIQEYVDAFRMHWHGSEESFKKIFNILLT